MFSRFQFIPVNLKTKETHDFSIDSPGNIRHFNVGNVFYSCAG
jgi:hypothetical protein